MSEQSFADRVNAELEKMGADPLTPAQADALEPSGLPQSQLGGLHPELRARITAANAALADFVSEHESVRLTGERLDYVSWAGRLAGELRGILEVIERHPS